MNIKGIHRTSLIDYPGKICSIFFSGGCNMKCRYCHNPELACNSSSLPTVRNEEALDYIRRRRGLIDGVSITGGEPTLSKNLASFIQSLRDLGISVKLDTNGMNPGVIESLLGDGLLDYVAIDIKTSPEKYGDLTGRPDAFPLIRGTMDIIRSSGVDYEVRTTCIPHYVTLKDLRAIGSEIGRVRRWFLQQFVNEVTLDESLRECEPYAHAELLALRDFARGFADVCEVRGI